MPWEIQMMALSFQVSARIKERRTRKGFVFSESMKIWPRILGRINLPWCQLLLFLIIWFGGLQSLYRCQVKPSLAVRCVHKASSFTAVSVVMTTSFTAVSGSWPLGKVPSTGALGLPWFNGPPNWWENSELKRVLRAPFLCFSLSWMLLEAHFGSCCCYQFCLTTLSFLVWSSFSKDFLCTSVKAFSQSMEMVI